MDKKTIKISKYLSFLLRHQPKSIGLKLDDNGWASIDELIVKTRNFKLTREQIDIVVETNDKKRFSISSDGKRIRANQGHSIDVELDLKPVEPPEILFHGTATHRLESINKNGLVKQQRHHVHLSESEEVARAVGIRYGKPVILTVAAKQMTEDGYVFFRSANNVWLVDHVPVKYLETPKS